MKLDNKIYDIMKWITLIAIPAFCTLYAAIASIWKFGGIEQVLGTAAALQTFLGVVLGISTSNYKIEQEINNEIDSKKKK